MKTIWEKVTAAHVPSVSLGGSSTEAAVLYKASPRQTKHGMELEGRGAKTISSLNNGTPRCKHSHGKRSFFFSFSFRRLHVGRGIGKKKIK